MFDAKKVAQDFPILSRKNHGKRFVYLNNAATTHKPRQVIEAISDYYSNNHGTVHRGMSEISAVATELWEKAHENIAKFVNADKEGTVFTKNTTESFNLLAYSFSRGLLKPGDEVLITKMEHHSNLVPWQQLSKERGFVVKFANFTKDGEIDIADLESRLSKKTRIVSFTHCSNVLGAINNATEICKIARDNGSISIMDGAQSVPHIPVDVKKIGSDFTVFSGHKMLGPTGIGVLIGKKEKLEQMTPFLYGGDMISEVFFDHSTWNELPYKFEAGTPNSEGGIGLSAAIDYLKKLGMEDIVKHENELTKYALDKLSSLGFVQTHGTTARHRTGVISFNVKGVHPHDVGGVLDEYGIEIRTGSHCAQPLLREMGLENGSARMSFYVYNHKEDVDLAIEAIQKTFKLMA